MNTESTVEDMSGPLNLGNPTENTVYQLAEIINEIIGGDHQAKFPEKLP
jgi:hypothetical protein